MEKKVIKVATTGYGVMGGGFIGTAFWPGLGTVIGGAIGAMLGFLFGTMTGKLVHK